MRVATSNCTWTRNPSSPAHDHTPSSPAHDHTPSSPAHDHTPSLTGCMLMSQPTLSVGATWRSYPNFTSSASFLWARAQRADTEVSSLEGKGEGHDSHSEITSGCKVGFHLVLRGWHLWGTFPTSYFVSLCKLGVWFIKVGVARAACRSPSELLPRLPVP